VTARILKTIALITVVTAAAGCQLLIDNRSRDSGAVVVVPSDEWESMRQASLASVPVSESDDLNVSQEITSSSLPVNIEAIPGSETIEFITHTSGGLGGCTTIGIIELQHQGAMDSAITILRNEAFRLNGNFLIPISMNSQRTTETEIITVEARILNCPLKLARGN
jgi:hypothetical protein